MAANNGHRSPVHDDVESQNTGTKIQPVFSTPDPEPWMIDPQRQTSSDMWGLSELFTLDMWRASVGELVGTAVLVFMLDTIVISTIQSDIKMPNLVLSVLAAIIIAILLLAVHPVSGGHINPIISFSAALVGLISMSRAIVYIAAQCVGATVGALALKAVVSSTIEGTFSLGGCTITVIAPGPNGPITIGLGLGQALWLEIFCSFIFLFASIWMAYDHRQASVLGHVLIFTIVGVVLGLLVFVSTTVTAQKGYAGAGMNPARCLGPAIVRGGPLWDGHWVFWVGPTIACAMFYLYTKIIPSQHHKSKAYDHDFFNVVQATFGVPVLADVPEIIPPTHFSPIKESTVEEPGDLHVDTAKDNIQQMDIELAADSAEPTNQPHVTLSIPSKVVTIAISAEVPTAVAVVAESSSPSPTIEAHDASQTDATTLQQPPTDTVALTDKSDSLPEIQLNFIDEDIRFSDYDFSEEVPAQAPRTDDIGAHEDAEEIVMDEEHIISPPVASTGNMYPILTDAHDTAHAELIPTLLYNLTLSKVIPHKNQKLIFQVQQSLPA